MKIFRASSLLSLVAAECNWQLHQKPKRCNDIEFTMEKTNSWVCRDCFNYRVNFKTTQLQIDWWWTNEDFIYLTFDEPVSFVTAAYPVKDAVLYSQGADGQQTYKLTFESNFNPGDKRIDFNIRKLNFAFSAINSSNSRIPRRQLDLCCVRCDNLSFLPPSSIFRGQRGSTSARSSS